MLYFQRWKIALILFVVVAGFIATIPNFFSAETVASWPSFLPKRQIVLGLDLRGGAHLLLEVNRDSLVADRVKTLEGDIRQTLRDAAHRLSRARRARPGRLLHAARPGRRAEGARRRCSRSRRRSSRASSARGR